MTDFLDNVLPILVLSYYKGMFHTANVSHPYCPHINNYWIPMPYLSRRGLGLFGEDVCRPEVMIVENHINNSYNLILPHAEPHDIERYQ